MAYPVYPVESYSNEPNKLPYPVRDNWSQKYSQAFKRVGMDDGHGRMRRRWDQQPALWAITWRFTWDQLEFFEAFLKYDVAQASGFFTMPLYPGGNPTDLRLTAYPSITFNEGLGAWEAVGACEFIRPAPIVAAKPGSLPVWPTTLPEPETSNYGIKRDTQVTRSNLGDGLANQRSRFRDEVATFTASWLLDIGQLGAFDDFVQNTLIGGLAPFQGYFVNGSGSNMTRINFTDSPVIAENGLAYKVSVTCESRDIPGMSEFNYRGYGKLALVDTFSYSELFHFRQGIGPTQQVTYGDAVKFLIKRGLADAYKFTEGLTYRYAAARTIVDTPVYTTSIGFKMTFPSLLQDTIGWRTSGSICQNLYCDQDYVQFGYTEDCASFNVESVGAEVYAFADTFAIISAYRPTLTDTLTLRPNGIISTQAYCTPDYVTPSYTMDQTLTF